MGMSKNRGSANGRYIERGPAGEKRCTKCRTWKPLSGFAVDQSRFDGRTYLCRPCRNGRKIPGPANYERRARREAGEAWCRGCEKWLPSDMVLRQGACQACINKEDRSRYVSSEAFRFRRRQRTQARKRGIAPIPFEAKNILVEDFDGLCAYCDNPATTLDHVVPISRGGMTEPYNILPACQSCNSSKRNSNLWEWLERTGRSLKDQAIARLCLYHESMYPPKGPDPF